MQGSSLQDPMEPNKIFPKKWPYFVVWGQHYIKINDDFATKNVICYKFISMTSKLATTFIFPAGCLVCNLYLIWCCFCIEADLTAQKEALTTSNSSYNPHTPGCSLQWYSWCVIKPASLGSGCGWQNPGGSRCKWDQASNQFLGHCFLANSGHKKMFSWLSMYLPTYPHHTGLSLICQPGLQGEMETDN